MLQIVDAMGALIELVDSNHGQNQTKAVNGPKWN